MFPHTCARKTKISDSAAGVAGDLRKAAQRRLELVFSFA
jgi:hypothetical protein